MDAKEKSFEFASDLTKQLITLSTAIITLTVTFSKDVFPAEAECYRGWMVAAWILYLFSIIFGIWTLMALTGTLEPKQGVPTPSIRGFNVTLPSLLQILAFLTGIGLTVTYAIKAV